MIMKAGAGSGVRYLGAQRQERGAWLACIAELQAVRRDSISEHGLLAVLAGQLDKLEVLALPNVALTPQDGGHAAATLCQAIPPESSNPNTTGLLRSRIARVVLELHTKQDSVRLTPVQLGVVLRFLKDTLLLLSDGSMLVHDVISALAIVLRLHGSTHDLTLEVDGFLPVLLRQADAPAELTYRSAALEALTATCVKSWPTLADKWRGAACNCLSSSLAAHWRLEDMQSIEAQLCATAASGLVQFPCCCCLCHRWSAAREASSRCHLFYRASCLHSTIWYSPCRWQGGA
eukprot:TRINITY_DN1333_c0_g1_i2.p1 TRINITY_DN1333_c0_g1~~TRINITY_DN1333_c0_g1_i2.p1  ORF type:complete len:299 (-),score=51.77 TRINITY_DN1333_c0_g1_i2:295-1164(-)